VKEPKLRDIHGALGKKLKNPMDDWIDKGNLACYLALEEETITNWQKEEELPFATVGRITFFSLKLMDKWLKGRVTTLVPEKKLRAHQGQKKQGMKKGAGAGEIGAICPLNGGHLSQTGMNLDQSLVKSGERRTKSSETK